MKIKVTETFELNEEEYEKGETIDFPDKVAKKVIAKGVGKKMKDEEEPKIEKIGEKEESKSGGPEWKRKIWISEDRNLSITVWPSGDKFDSPSINLEESRRDDSGNWETNKLYLPTGSSLLALSENLKSAWNQIQKMKAENK